jgi:hypothetical protein
MTSSNSSDCDESVSSNNFIAYGPIRYFSRKGKAPTLSTGRKSKFQELHGDELIQRELRREKNRLLSKKLKEKRETILNKLLQQVDELEGKHSHLLSHIEQLQLYKNDLSYELETINQDPLLNLINQNEVRLFFEQYDYQDFDTNSLISMLSTEESSIDDLFSDESP